MAAALLSFTQGLLGVVLALVAIGALDGSFSRFTLADEGCDSCRDGLLLQSCGLGGSNFTSCMEETITKNLRRLEDGERVGLDRIDPFHVHEWMIDTPLLSLKLYDIKVMGLYFADVKNFTTTPTSSVTSRMAYVMHVPEIQIEGRYEEGEPQEGEGDGEGRWRREQGEGFMMLRIIDYRTVFELDVLLEEGRENKVYATFTRSLSRVIDCTSGEIHLSTKPEISDFLNRQPALLLSLLADSIAEKQSEINLAYVLRVFRLAPPVEVLFPANVTGPTEVCLRKRPRLGASCTDLYGRGF